MHLTKKAVARNEEDFNTFLNEFKVSIEILKKYFIEMIQCNFNEESMKQFEINHEKLIRNTYIKPGTKTYFISYWFQIMRKLKTEILTSNNIELKKRFDLFFKSYENKARQEMMN